MSQLASDLDQCASLTEHRFAFPIEAARRELAGPLLRLREGLAGDRSIEFRDGPFDEYRRSTETLFATAPSDHLLARRAFRWRMAYVALDTGLDRMGGRFAYLQARSAPHLFEIWCFSELANLVAREGEASVMQRSLLRSSGTEHTFEIGAETPKDVYFNFKGEAATLSEPRKILSETRVEWMVLDPDEYERSTVIDTKFKRWDTTDHLKVLGYMNDFGCDRGIVIFKEPLRPDGYHQRVDSDRFSLTRFGRQEERIFCAMALVPRAEEIDANGDALRTCLDQVLLASG